MPAMYVDRNEIWIDNEVWQKFHQQHHYAIIIKPTDEHMSLFLSLCQFVFEIQRKRYGLFGFFVFWKDCLFQPKKGKKPIISKKMADINSRKKIGIFLATA